ncbi:MAG: hypothetical protein M1829_006678 [Trizodia sp. TS-e1964]|nr:MAG: hypothetical protein M1829_006678 [Trizodia sp. TS-e1964]
MSIKSVPPPLFLPAFPLERPALCSEEDMLKRLRLRGSSNSWVMLSETEGFIHLPGERIIYTSPPRTSLSLQTSPTTYPADQPIAISSNTGCVHLTNQRIVYLPASSTPNLQSFSSPILNLHNTHVSAPFFGPNVWTATLQPVAGGGIPATHAAVELKMVFKDGGAFDFHSHFEAMKERIHQAVDVARESGHISGNGAESGNGGGGGGLSGVNLASLHLEQLPAYEEANPPSAARITQRCPNPPPTSPPQTVLISPDQSQEASYPRDLAPSASSAVAAGVLPPTETYLPPPGPPPGYEEAQAQSVGNELERQLRKVA